MLEEDGFGEYLDLVDAYKALGGPMTFAEFALSRPDEFSQAIGAADDGRCAFHALSCAMDAVGLVGWFSGAAVDEFYDVQAAKGPQRKSHAFTMIVTTAGRFASDDEVVQVPLLEYAAPWLAEVRFVRRVLIR
ncbi:hypothetical protein PF008_g16248 [Phytophthora fragariae]|uniref:Uncharacterized protein n=1 Tax=Phytophthora fragariae TaxID=53985 RepID=A0A6G0RCM2_9STRA|nr:hypothetical protein PF008_g16248 [Phytophthora fragariae]